MAKKKSDSGLIILLSSVIIIAITLLIVNILQQDTGSNSELASSCQSAGGTWLTEFNECEYVDQETCRELGGDFNECDSACRHESGSVACTMNCVQVCSF